MNPAIQLKRLLRGRGSKPVTGEVIEVDGVRVRVSTGRGVIEAKSVDATSYKAGDNVLVQDGVIQGRVKRASDVPVYFV